MNESSDIKQSNSVSSSNINTISQHRLEFVQISVLLAIIWIRKQLEKLSIEGVSRACSLYYGAN